MPISSYNRETWRLISELLSRGAGSEVLLFPYYKLCPFATAVVELATFEYR
jgi:hypothetical protein